jgi:nucleoside diphosphate kinase
MADELTYVLISPYSLHKSRTGGIMSRLLSLTHLQLVEARMYAFSDELAEKFAGTIGEMDIEPHLRQAFVQYCEENLRRDNPLGISNRCLVLFFKGPNAVRHMKDDVVGSITRTPMGDRVRRTYGDFIGYPDGDVRYFEPAVICAADHEANRKQLTLLDEYAESDGGVIEESVTFPDEVLPRVQTTLVILKPENFARPSRKPGNIIDVFAASGCYFVGAKLFSMTVNQGLEFYGPLEEMFVERLKGKVTEELRRTLSPVFKFPVSDDTFAAMSELVKHQNATYEFYRIVEYMTGLDPAKVTDPVARNRPGASKCLALLYRGPSAVQVIRHWLGSTDPDAAAPGTVRSDFARDLMRNGAHASDSVENAERERKIIGLWGQQDAGHLHKLVAEYLEQSALVTV